MLAENSKRPYYVYGRLSIEKRQNRRNFYITDRMRLVHKQNIPD